MRALSPFFATAFLVISLCSCRTRFAPPTRRGTTMPTTRPIGKLRAIEYHLTGGFLGNDKMITISPGGDIAITGRTATGRRTDGRSGHLTAAQREDLVSLFVGWDTLKDDYPEIPGVSDGLEYAIRYGKKTVTAGDVSDVPPSFTTARKMIEGLADALSRDKP